MNVATPGLQATVTTQRLRHFMGIAFLLALCIPLLLTLRAHPAGWRLTSLLLCLLLYIVGNVAIMLRGPHYPTYSQQGDQLLRATFFGLGVLTIVMTLVGGNQWLLLFIFDSVSAAKVFNKQEVIVALGCIECVVLLLGIHSGANWQDVFQIEMLIIGSGAIITTYRRLTTTIDELQSARQEIAQFAIAEERLRFARDLHDLLGHSLSLIALKSEVAARMLDSDTQRVALEVRDIESVARAALQEVRDAVANYRQSSLATELEAAQHLLTTAAIALEVATIGLPVPLAVAHESALAWAVREGMTNVVRHSGARRCALTMHYAQHAVTVTIQDDGQGNCDFQPGNGLRGLQERLQALGGSVMTTGSADHRLTHPGFCLVAQLPLVSGEADG